jgi:hypothetical protein
MTVEQGLQKLTSLLPLKARQDALQPELRELHRDILRSFATNGEPLTRQQIANRVGQSQVDAVLSQLSADDLVVLAPDGREISGAYPYTVEQRVHRVEVNGHQVHAMCALDAISIAPMADAQTKIHSRCHVTDSPVEITMQGNEVLSATPADVHVGIRWQSTSGCAAKNLCLEMVYLKDTETARAWQQQDPDNIDIYPLSQAVVFGSAFFRPLLAA